MSVVTSADAAGTTRPRVAIILRYGLNPHTWRERHDRGELVDATPYAYHLAGDAFELTWSNDHRESGPIRWARSGLRSVLGFDLLHVWRNRKTIAEADAVWTHTEREHLGVALLKMLRPNRYRAVSVAQSVWLWDAWPKLPRPHAALFARLLRRHAVELVHSRVNRDISRSAVPDRVVVRAPFGTHLAPPPSAEPRRPGTPPRVLVVGNDRHRDWPLLAEVARRMPGVDVDIVSLSHEVTTMSWPSNVVITSLTQREVFEQAYASASVVALPLRDNRHVSGCTVAIEAISAARPIVATDTGGIDEYLLGAAATLVPLGDVDAFVAGIHHHLGDLATPADASLAARRGLSSADYVGRMTSLTLSALQGRPIDPAVELFAPIGAAVDAEREVAR